jgi:hypothetical protein
MSSFNSYPKVWNVGHGAVKDIFSKTLLVEEKIDGSQFSFGDVDGRLRMKSHHQDISDIVGEYGLFTEVIAYVRGLYEAKKLVPGYTYRVEVLQKPTHNKLSYERVPKHHMIGFDIATGDEQYMGYVDKVTEFNKLDLETVPYIYYGVVNSPDTIDSFLGRQSILGGKMIEGVVFKAYGVFGEDKKTLMAKYVNKAFRELKDTGENQKSSDFLTDLVETYRSEARWVKAVQRLREQGKLLNEPKDIGPLIGAIVDDLKEEEGMSIMAKLMKRYWPHIARGATGGFAEWYKRQLMEGAFKQDETDANHGGPSLDAATTSDVVQAGAVSGGSPSEAIGSEIPVELPGSADAGTAT